MTSTYLHRNLIAKMLRILLLIIVIQGATLQASGIAIDEPTILDIDSKSAKTVTPTIDTFNNVGDGDKNQPQKLLEFLDTIVPPATATRLSWQPKQSLEGLALATPVLVVNGYQTGPTLCLTAAVHGDELNGIEIVRHILYSIDPKKLSGTVIGVPIVNLQGFQRSSRYLTDRRDLNRFFPGNPLGSSASRIAYSFFNDVISYCDYLVDLHTGSAHRTNLPQIRANLHHPKVAKFARGFGATVTLHSDATLGTLRRAAVDANIPAVTLEAGESLRLQETAVSHGIKSIETLLNKMQMLKNIHAWNDAAPIYYTSAWVRVDRGGILFGNVELGDKVQKNDVLGVVTDPITNTRSEIVSPYQGQVIGMAVDQVVMPGFAGFHIGIQDAKEEMSAVNIEMKNKPDDQLATTNNSQYETPETDLNILLPVTAMQSSPALD